MWLSLVTEIRRGRGGKEKNREGKRGGGEREGGEKEEGVLGSGWVLACISARVTDNMAPTLKTDWISYNIKKWERGGTTLECSI